VDLAGLGAVPSDDLTPAPAPGAPEGAPSDGPAGDVDTEALVALQKRSA
jgi:hypothetical protein